MEQQWYYGSHPRQFLDLFLPERRQFDLLICFHGGGLESGSCRDYPALEDLKKTGMAVAAPEYRIYPEAVFPDFILDAAAAVACAIRKAESWGKINRIFISGQSAGAYLTLMLCFDSHYLVDAGVERKRICGYIADSAQVTTHFNVLRERGLDPRLERIDEASAFFHLSENSDVQNLLLLYYSQDMECRPEQNILFYRSVQRLCPGRNIQLRELPGPHCAGSCFRNAEGNFDYNEALLHFIRSI